MDAADVGERVAEEEPGRAVIGVLIFFSRREDHRRPEVADQARDLLREIFAAEFRVRHDHLRLRRSIEARVRRPVRGAPLRPVRARQLAEPAVREAEEGVRRAIEAERRQRVARFATPAPAVAAVVGSARRFDVPLVLHTFGVAVAVGQVDDVDVAAAFVDALHEPARGQRLIVGVRRDDEQPGFPRHLQRGRRRLFRLAARAGAGVHTRPQKCDGDCRARRENPASGHRTDELSKRRARSSSVTTVFAAWTVGARSAPSTAS